MEKHTLGPWRVLPEEADRSYIRIRGTRLGGRYKIANVLVANEFDVEEARANANLIAAAPAMYEALKNLRELAEDWAPNPKYHNEGQKTVLMVADKALGQAEGRDA